MNANGGFAEAEGAADFGGALFRQVAQGKDRSLTVRQPIDGTWWLAWHPESGVTARVVVTGLDPAAVGDVVDDYPTTVAAHLVASEVAEEVTDAPPRTRRKSRKEDDGG